MTIWDYQERLEQGDKPLIVQALKVDRCLFCETRMRVLSTRTEAWSKHSIRDLRSVRKSSDYRIEVCDICGWWKAQNDFGEREERVNPHVASYRCSYGGIGRLRNLDLTDISIPIQEVRDFLTVQFDRRNDLHPRRFEETVASVFRDIGYHTKITAYSGDEGIDIILDGPKRDSIGVQVKRSKNSIEVEQIRAFTGALVLGGYTRGIFVTTSRFQSGASQTAQRASSRGIPIELMDAPRLYDALRLAQRRVDRSKEDFLARATGRHFVLLRESGVRPRRRRRAKLY